jgi:hypothetical protein
VRLFFDHLDALDFALAVWRSPAWRLLSEVEVERTGLGFRRDEPF